MGIAILWFVGFLIFIYLHADIRDHDERLRILEKRKVQDSPTLREAATADTKGVEIEET